MVELGARESIMTLPDGCLALLGTTATDERAVFRATLDPLEPVSAVGSGDAFLAGFVAARYAGSGNEDCLRFAVACGAESTQHFGAGVVDLREVERLRPEVASSGSSPRRSAPEAVSEAVPRGSADARAAVLTSSVRPSSNLGWPNGS